MMLAEGTRESSAATILLGQNAQLRGHWAYIVTDQKASTGGSLPLAKVSS
jgi:hypothetical protein